ncbi:MAG TPA: hypothetical protein VFZ77_02205, partial [Acidimicrobiales bacterium]
MRWPTGWTAGRRLARLARALLWGSALVAVLTVGRASPAAGLPSGAGTVDALTQLASARPDPCAGDAGQAIGQWDCLPFYRWADEADSFHSNFGRSEVTAPAMQSIVTLLFGIAGLMWRLLQWVTRTALAFDLFATVEDGRSTPVALQPLNDGFAAIARVVLSGIGMTVLAVTVLVVIVRALRDGATPVRDLARPLVCLGLLLFLLSRAEPLPGGGAQVGSPAWVAQRGVGMSNLVGDQISAAAPRRDGAVPPDNVLDCHHYVRRLRSSFDRDATTGGDLVGSVAFQPQLASHMSALWEAAYLDLWVGAQFGRDPDLARRSYCRLLEDRAGVPPAEQAAITMAALSAAGAGTPPPGELGTAPFGRFNGDKDLRRGMVAWGVCGWYADRTGLSEEVDGRLVPLSGPGFAVNPEFRLMWNLGSPPSESRDGTCSHWWGVDGSGTTKPPPRGTKWGVSDGDGPFQFGTRGDIDEAFAVYGEEELSEQQAAAADVAPYTAEDRENLAAARNWVLAFNGHNLAASVPSGCLAIVIAAVYLWAIGGLAFGTLVAQFLVVLYFVALPLLLVVGMWPSRGEGGVFWRFTRVGAGSLFAKAVFAALLSVLMALISVIDELAELSGAFRTADGGAGFGGVMVQAAAPVVAILMLRWALRSLGMGNIFSLRGAVGLTGRLARGADAHAGASRASTWASTRRERWRDEHRARRLERGRERRERRAAVTPGDPRWPAAGGRAVGAKRLLRGGLAAAAGGALLATPVSGAVFAAAPLVGGLAVGGWAAGRASRNRFGPADLPPRQGRAPTPDEVARVSPTRVGDAYGEHAELVVAAGNLADPERARHHPDVGTRRSGATRVVTPDGRVCRERPSGRRVEATAGWGPQDG